MSVTQLVGSDEGVIPALLGKGFQQAREVCFVENFRVFLVPEQRQLWPGGRSPLNSGYSHFSSHFT